MMQELCLQTKVDRSFDTFNEFEAFLIEKTRELMSDRIREYVERLDETVSSRFKSEHPDYPEVSGRTEKLNSLWKERFGS